MSKWTYEQLHMRYASLDGADSRELADAIRADIAAVEAERDELKRRLVAVVEYVKAHGWRIQDTECQRTIDDIAEGRDNG